MSAIDEAKPQFDKAIEHLATALNGIRTGRATPAILEPISVEAYGSMQPIKALASISVPDAKTLQIEPWDPTVVKAIESAIMKSDIGIMPNTDGKVIRLSMPSMTDETRQKMVKIMKEKLEDGKVSVRKIREEVKKKIEKSEGGEDEQRNLLKKLDETVKALNAKIEAMGEKKEKRLQRFNMDVSMDKIVQLAKSRGFIFPGSDIYGGLANSWDYGPLGAELKNNIKQAWWKRFVHGRLDVVGIDAALIMNPKVWAASGHLKTFTDPLVECKQCHERYRADKIDLAAACQKCGTKGQFTEPAQFNLMFKTFIGPKEDATNTVYLRPETAQAMFVDFPLIVNSSRKRVPFGVAQIGKAFRNEITPGNFIFRTREFEQMEIEYFIHPNDWKQPFESWLKEMHAWIADCGIDAAKIHDLEVPGAELAHYSERTVDIEFDFPFGRSELYGIAYRTDFDLKNHAEHSGATMTYRDPISGETYIPHVIEPTFGVDRTLLAVLLSAYHEEEVDGEKRVVLKIAKQLAPVKIAVLPLSKKDELKSVAEPLALKLAKRWNTDYDETQSIGKRYRRQDEIGTPYCVTVDFDSLNDHAVTVRDRDTMKQERIAIDKLEEYFESNLP